MIPSEFNDQMPTGDGFSSTSATIEGGNNEGGNVIDFPRHVPPPANSFPDYTPPKNTPPPQDSHEPSDFERFADVLARIVGAGVSVPTTGDPIVAPNPSRAMNSLPLIIIIVSLAIMGYLYYKKHTSRGRLAVENE